MKQAMILTALLLTVGSASATTPPPAPTQTSTVKQGQDQAQTTAVNSNAVAGASNQGNNQTIVFSAPTTSTTNVNQSVSGTQTVNQNVSGTTTQNQNQVVQVSGTTTQNQNQVVQVSGTTTQNQNQNVKSDTTINGKQEQVVSGGTNNTVHQTFGTQTIKNTPSVSGSPLVSSNDTCMGSASGSINGPGFGLSLGKTYTDENCVMLKNSRELWNMGMKGAAMALMCSDSKNRYALEITGYRCPQSGGVVQHREQTAVQYHETVKAAQSAEPTDPYVRARMGLPKIKE